MIKSRVLPLLLIFMSAIIVIAGCLPMGSTQPRIPALWISAVAVPVIHDQPVIGQFHESELKPYYELRIPYKIYLHLRPDGSNQWDEEFLGLADLIGPQQCELNLDHIGLTAEWLETLSLHPVILPVDANISDTPIPGVPEYKVTLGYDPAISQPEFSNLPVLQTTTVDNMTLKTQVSETETKEEDDFPIKLKWDGYYRFGVRYNQEARLSAQPSVGGLGEAISWRFNTNMDFNIPAKQSPLITGPFQILDAFQPDTESEPVDSDDFRLEKLWAEVEVYPDSNRIAFGRMPSNWGLGLFANQIPEWEDMGWESTVEQVMAVLYNENRIDIGEPLIWGIPIDTQLFPIDAPVTIKEPMDYVLSLTFEDCSWLSMEQDRPQESDLPVPETEPLSLRVIISSPKGGEVELSTSEGIKKYDYGPEGTWQTSMAFEWIFNEEQEITMTAKPFEGYRFVAWESEFYEIQDPSSPLLKLGIKPPMVFSNNPRETIVRAYFALVIEEPQDEPIPTMQETLYVSFEGGGQCTATQSSCSCNLAISIEGKDLTGGSYPVTNVTLTVNGDVWEDSGNISETHFTRTIERTVDCDKTYNIELTAINSIGQTVSSTGSVSTAR